jgi:arylsulfatase A-like enzyme
MNRTRKGSSAKRYLIVGLMVAVVLVLCGLFFLSRGKNRPNIILISIDTLRTDHIHGYGYGPPTTPVLDGLMERGTSFSQAISPSPWTLPSHLSLFTSLYPHTHGVVNDQYGLQDDIPTLPELLKRAGYKTTGYASCIYLFPGYGYDRGFDQYLDVSRIPAPALFQKAGDWLIEAKPEPYFLFLHFFDVHHPYTPRDEYLGMFESSYEGTVEGDNEHLTSVNEGTLELSDEDLRHLIALYDAEIRQLDDSLGIFLDFIRAKGFLDNTVIVITSDHGEEFLDHGNVLHTRTLYDELLRVPLIITGTGIEAGAMIDQQVELIDIMPTILDLCGIRAPRGIEGSSLLALMGREAGDWEQIAFAEADWDSIREIRDIYRAVRTGRYKYYHNRMTNEDRLFDLLNDPGEKVNILEKEPDVAKEHRDLLMKWMATKRGNPKKINFIEKEGDLLRALGYLK